MSVYIINGAPGSGKTTFEEVVKDIVGENYCLIYSTIDFVKKIANLCGWDGEKTPKNRRFLSDLKKLLADWNNVPVKQTMYRINQFLYELNIFDIDEEKAVIFIDCREPEEIDKLKAILNAKTVLISRESAEKEKTSNSSDSEVLNYDYDILIDNNGTLEDLLHTAETFVEIEGLHKKTRY